MNTYCVALSFISLLFLQACASTGVEAKLDEKLTHESEIRNRSDLTAEAHQVIDAAAGLSPERKEKLAALRSSTQSKLDEISTQSLRLRSILIKDLVSPQYDETEVTLIKRRIRSLDSARTEVLFSAIEQANTILGHDTEGRAMIMRNLWLEDRGRSR